MVKVKIKAQSKQNLIVVCTPMLIEGQVMQRTTLGTFSCSAQAASEFLGEKKLKSPHFTLSLSVRQRFYTSSQITSL